MAFTIINQAVAKVVMDAKLNIVDELITYLGSKIELDDDIKNIFNEFKLNLKEHEEKIVKIAGKKIKVETNKKKRQPSVFNMYVKDVMPSIKEKNSDIKDGKKLISMAAESWKTEPMALFIKEQSVLLKSDNPTITIFELYEKTKDLWNKQG
jgi:uncharacterized protein (UPF0335 family)